MKLKFIQVNIYKGKYFSDLVGFLTKEDPDFISMQEVTTNGFNLCEDKSISLFEVLKDKLKMYGVYNGDLQLVRDPTSVFGSAVFSKYKITSKNVVILKKFRPVTISELDGVSGQIRKRIDRHLLDATIDIEGLIIHIMSWHGAWTAPPADNSETLRQAKIVADYLKNLDGPFILGCDANNIPESKTVGLINNVCVNLMIGQNVSQTTHPKVHKIAPRGYLVDYVFTSKHFSLKSLLAEQVLVSDHLPVVCELEF